ncbi:MAG: CPBP family intramembrane metalloprotease [Ruminococcaceae bacterium]|nr:CPBP family intramembrane metalloprotease [Oscillospiraceae bacterium]
MKYSEFLSHSLTSQEKIYGTVWLAFEALLFPRLLQLLNTLLPVPLTQASINALFFGINFLVVAILFRRYLVGQAKLIPDTVGKSIAVALVGFAAYSLASFFMLQFLLAIDPHFASVNDLTIRDLVKEDFLLMFVGTVILVPITEECLLRGLVFRGLYDRSPLLAWAASVVIFSAVHLISYIGLYPLPTMLLCFVQYIPAGLCLAGAYRLSGSLLSPILIHALVNLMGMLALR